MKNFTHFHEHINIKYYESKKQILFLIAICISVIGYSQTFTALDNNNNTLEFNIISTTTVEVKDYISGGTDIDIPETVSNNGTTYDVTGIGILAFLSNGLTSVAIPNSITSIGVGAFQNNSLTSITIPNGVATISNNAFSTNQLASVTIPSGITSIGNNAFLNNNQLTSVSLSEGLISIGNDAFLNCQLSTVTLPSTLTSIGIRAFINNPLTSVVTLSTTPPSITTTPGNGGSDSFAADRSNIDLFIPSGTTADYLANSWTGFNSVTEAGSAQVGDTFVVDFITYKITSLSPNEVQTVDYNMAGGTVVNIPAIVTNTNLTYDVVSIGNNAFSSKGLTSVTIPNSVVTIELQAFNTNNLSGTLTIPDSVLTIGNGAFAGSSLTEVIFGNNLTDIGGGAFIGNNLTDIIIPSSVTNIDMLVFLNNPLSSVTSLATTPPTIDTSSGGDTFAADRSNIALHIPPGTMGAYVTDPGALWTGFNPVTEDALSIDEFELVNTVKVITATDVIKIVTDNGLKLQEYTIYSISGVEIAKGRERHISTNTFANGVYILKLNFDKGTITKKVVVNYSI